MIAADRMRRSYVVLAILLTVPGTRAGVQQPPAAGDTSAPWRTPALSHVPTPD